VPGARNFPKAFLKVVEERWDELEEQSLTDPCGHELQLGQRVDPAEPNATPLLRVSAEIAESPEKL